MHSHKPPLCLCTLLLLYMTNTFGRWATITSPLHGRRFRWQFLFDPVKWMHNHPFLLLALRKSFDTFIGNISLSRTSVSNPIRKGRHHFRPSSPLSPIPIPIWCRSTNLHPTRWKICINLHSLEPMNTDRHYCCLCAKGLRGNNTNQIMTPVPTDNCLYTPTTGLNNHCFQFNFQVPSSCIHASADVSRWTQKLCLSCTSICLYACNKGLEFSHKHIRHG